MNWGLIILVVAALQLAENDASVIVKQNDRLFPLSIIHMNDFHAR